MDDIYKGEVWAINFLQKAFPGGEWFFMAVSRLSDPLCTFLYLVPLVTGLHFHLGANLLATTVLIEWINTMLKWLLMEDRPYWWVQETTKYHGQLPVLRQTPLTCETGPGSPSGHVMNYGAVAFILAEHFSAGAPEGQTVAIRILFFGTVMLVSLSRVYVATHFPHQCMLGIVLAGTVVWMMADRFSGLSRWYLLSRTWALCTALMLCSIALAAYWLQKLLGVDPQWSVRLAFKWCERPEFLHVNTTPLFSLVRSCGALVGMAFCCPMKVRLRVGGRQGLRLVCSVLLAFAFHQVTQLVPTRNTQLFYMAQFLLHAAQPYLLLKLVQRIASP